MSKGFPRRCLRFLAVSSFTLELTNRGRFVAADGKLSFTGSNPRGYAFDARLAGDTLSVAAALFGTWTYVRR